MNTFTRISTMILAITLVGCSSKPYTPNMFQQVTTPKPIDHTKSTALNYMEQGFSNVPYDIEDMDVPDEYGVQSDVFLGSAVAYSSLALNLTAGWMMLPGALTTNSMKSKVVKFIYVPADDIDITDTVKIREYIRNNYTLSAVNKYIESESKNVKYPTRIVKTLEKHKITKAGHITVQGHMCQIAIGANTELYGNKRCSFDSLAYPVRYVTPETILLKNPDVHANRYILVSMNVRVHELHLINHYDTNMVAYLLPASSDIDHPRSIRSAYPNLLSPVPRVLRMNRGNKESLLFVKPKI